MADILNSTLVSALAVGLALLAIALWLCTSNQHLAPLPPGPKGLPLIGNINDLPPAGAPDYQHWIKFKELYGPLSCITVLGQTFIIIHDKAIAFELMEKRALKHSGRPKMQLATEMVGWRDITACLPYGPAHRLHRKYAYQQLGSKTAVAKYHALQETAVGRFLWRLKRDGGANLEQHLKTEAADMILDVVYGYTIEPHGRDPLVDIVNKTMDDLALIGLPGKWAVDMLPFLARVPSWMPGAGFKRAAHLFRRNLMQVADAPYEFAKGQMSQRPDSTSFVAKAIEQARRDDAFGEAEERAIKWSAASMYTGGADTTVGTIAAFFLAMSIFPDVQRKAQDEIDRVVGKTRLPNFDDREHLPYVNAIVEEAQRWHPIATMSLPHMTDEEDSINGLRIPKGAMLMTAVWWFTRDTATYHDPESFKPERYSEPYNEPSATKVTFGFGRRACPGKVLADASLYLTFAQSLAAFTIQKALDASGKEVEPEHSFGGGVVAHPGHFEIRIKPRTRQHDQLVDGVVEKYPWTMGDKEFVKLS